jgi:hypothetical protein
MKRNFASLAIVASTVALSSCQGGIDYDPAKEGLQEEPATSDTEILRALCINGSTEVKRDVNVRSQAQLATLAGCKKIDGALIINDSTDIVDLGVLSTLEEIQQGFFLAFNNSALTSVNLPNLVTVEQGFAVIRSPEVTTIAAPVLANLAGDLTVRDVPKLTAMQFNAVTRILNDGAGGAGNLIVGNAPLLPNLEGLSELFEIDGAFTIFGSGITNFSGLEKLQRINNKAGLNAVVTANRVDKLNPMIAVGIDFDNDFNIVAAGNPNLESFEGLDALDIGVAVNGNDANDVAGDIVIAFNPELKNLNGFDDLRNVRGNIYIAGNENLEDLSGLDGDNSADNDDDGLETVTGSIFLGLLFDRFGEPLAAGNPELTTLKGLDSLTAVTGALVIAFNNKFENLEGAALLSSLGTLTFAGTDPDDLSGADALTSVNKLVFGELLGRDGIARKDVRNAIQPNDNEVATSAVEVNLNLNGGEKGFTSLTSVAGDVVIAFSTMPDLRFSKVPVDLTSIGGRLILHSNVDVTLNNLDIVTNLGGLVVNLAVDVRGNFVRAPNSGFADFTGIGGQRDLGAGGLHVGFSEDLDDFIGLPPFGQIIGDVTLVSAEDDIEQDVGPQNLGNLVVNDVVGNINICAIENPDGAIIAPLNNLTDLNLNVGSAGSLFVAFCPELVSANTNLGAVAGSFELTSLESLTNINVDGLNTAGDINVHDLVNLQNVSLGGLNAVSGGFRIANNPDLDNLNLGINNIGGSLEVVNNPSLTSLNAFAGLGAVGGDVAVIDCPDIQDTFGFDALNSIGGSLQLRRLDAISNQAVVGGNQQLSFASLVEITGSLEIVECADLEDLAGLQSLSVVGDSIILDGNAKLKTLFGLQGLTAIRRKISVRNHPELETIAFDDDNQDREVDFNDNDGVNNEAEDPDATFESGLRQVGFVGEPFDIDGIAIGGQSGVVEFINNPKLDEGDVNDFIDDLDVNFDGFSILCGNENSIDDEDPNDNKFNSVTCLLAP